MRPILFTWRGLTVHSYPALQYIGLCAGVVAGNGVARVMGLDAFRVFVATCILLFPALAGARLLHVASNWDRYRRNHRLIWDRSMGGAAQYGGILVAVPISFPLLKLLAIPFVQFWDAAMITILVGMIFTRFGCLLNGCCAGRPTSRWFGLRLPDHGVWEKRIPTQLLEAGWAAALLASALLMWQKLSAPGSLFLYVSAGYAAGRLLLETTRPLRRTGRPFTLHHGISLVIIALCLTALTLSK